MAFELTSVTLIQDYLGDTSASSTTLTTMANAAEAMIARRCNRFDDAGGNHWLTASHTDRITADFARRIGLKHTPISAISSVTITAANGVTYTVPLTSINCDGIAIASLATNNMGFQGVLAWYGDPVTSTAAWFDAGLPRPSAYSAIPSPNFGSGYKSLIVAYTGGYASTSVVPGDLTLAATELSAMMYREKNRDPFKVSETLGQWSAQFAQATKDDPKFGGLISKIEPYRRYLN